MTGVDWRRYFPLLLALAFCVYAAGSIHQSQEARRKLRDSEIAAIVEQNYRLTATLDDYLTEQRRHIAELAEGPEVRNFLANRALGMLMRYGLQSSLDDVTARFRRVLAERRYSERRFFTRLALIDDDGAVLTSVGVAEERSGGAESDAAVGRDGLSVDAASNTLRITAPTGRLEAGGGGGTVVAWADLGAMLRFLLPTPAGPYDRTAALTPAGLEIAAYPNLAPMRGGLSAAALSLSPGSHAIVFAPDTGQDVVVAAAQGPQSGLVLATLRRAASLKAGAGAADYLLFATATPLIALAAALFFERMQRRQSHLELVLKASRERLLAVADNLAEGLALVGPDEKILFVNRTALRLLGGAEKPQAMVGRPLSDLLRLRDPAATPWRRTAADGRPHGLDDAYLIAADGGMVNAALRCAPLEDPVAGAAAIVSFRDIRAEKEAQRQTMQTARLVAIGQLAAGIAHEINTPAQYITTNLAFLDDEMEKLLRLIRAGRATSAEADLNDEVDFLLEEVPKAVTESREGVEQIARIVRSVKEFAHPAAAALGPADINHAVETALTVSRNVWKNILTIELNLQCDLPPVACNIGEINQVFLNLIANAADAVEAQRRDAPGRLQITTRADGDMMEARFADDGPGVPANAQDRIFDPFYTTKAVGKGTGQGLAICRNIVAVKHHGSLSVESAPQGGAAFIVRLPFNPPEDSTTGLISS